MYNSPNQRSGEIQNMAPLQLNYEPHCFEPKVWLTLISITLKCSVHPCAYIHNGFFFLSTYKMCALYPCNILTPPWHPHSQSRLHSPLHTVGMTGWGQSNRPVITYPRISQCTTMHTTHTHILKTNIHIFITIITMLTPYFTLTLRIYIIHNDYRECTQ